MAIRVDNVGGKVRIMVYQRRNSLPLIVLAALISVYAGAALRVFPAYRDHPPSAAFTVGAIPMILLFVFISVKTNKRWLGGCEVVTVTPSTMEIESRFLGKTRTSHNFVNQTVRNLRYEEWFPDKGRWRFRQLGVRFEYKGVTQTIALDADANDCMDLIDRMVEVYKFSTAASQEPSVV
jgi:hypothetical protein